MKLESWYLFTKCSFYLQCHKLVHTLKMHEKVLQEPKAYPNKWESLTLPKPKKSTSDAQISSDPK